MNDAAGRDTAADTDALRAENERLRSALKAAVESLMYFDVGKRTEAYIKVVKTLEYLP